MKITIDFDDGIKREYEINESIADALRYGESIIIEICHPSHGEICMVKINDK